MYQRIITSIVLLSSFIGYSQLKTKKYDRNVSNKTENEIAPFISLDGKTLIYTRKRAMDGDWKTQISVFQNNKWQRASTLEILNKLPKQRLLGSYALNADASKILFVSNRYGGVGTFDIWLTEKNTAGIWSAPTNLAKPVNSSKEEVNPIFSHDEKSIYFVRRNLGSDNGDVYQSYKKGSFWKEPIKLPFSGQYFAPRIAGDNKTMYLSKIISEGMIEMYVSRFENNVWSEPTKISEFPKNTDKYFATSSSSTNLTISNKQDETYDLFQIKLPQEHTSTSITNLTISIDTPHKVKINKRNDKKYNFLKTDIDNLYLLNDDIYTISILFKDYLPIVNEINLDGRGYSSKKLSPRPIKADQGAVSVLDFFESDNKTIHESLFKSEINALKAFASANPTKTFELTYYQNNVSLDSIKSETHTIEVVETIKNVNIIKGDETESQVANDQMTTKYSNDNSETMLLKIQELCGNVPANIQLTSTKQRGNSFKNNQGVFVIVK